MLRLDPRFQSRSAVLADLALSHLLIGHHEDAIDFARRAVDESPENVRAHQRLVAAPGHAGRETEVHVALEELLRRQSDLSRAYLESTYPFRRWKDLELFLDGLQRAGWKEGGTSRAGSRRHDYEI